MFRPSPTQIDPTFSKWEGSSTPNLTIFVNCDILPMLTLRVQHGLPTSRTEVHLPRHFGKFLLHPVLSRQSPRQNPSTGVFLTSTTYPAADDSIIFFEDSCISYPPHCSPGKPVRLCRDKKLPLVLAIMGIAAVPIQFYKIGGYSFPLSIASQVLGITTRGTRTRPAFIPSLAFGRVRGFHGEAKNRDDRI